MRGAISNNLTSTAIHFLVDAASDQDKTVRLQATEFLYRLRDQRVIGVALDIVQQTRDQNGKYNNILILKGLYPYLDKSVKTRVLDGVKGGADVSSQKTDSLVKSFPPP
jgi:hypothetical protein